MVTQEYIYAYAAISIDGGLDSLILPHVDSICMQVFIHEAASRYRRYQIIMILEGAGWNTSGFLKLPENLKLIPLPPYAPEPNPTEHVWDDLREKSFHNRVFESIDQLEKHLETPLREMECDKREVCSTVAWPWTIN
jgi:hypothetical protein